MHRPSTLIDLWRRLQAAGATPFLSHRQQDWSSAGFAQHASALAAHLQRHGVVAGDRVVFWLEKGVEDAAAPFAAALVGAISVIANPRLKADQLAHVVQHAGASLCVTSISKWAAAGELRDDRFAGVAWTTVDEVEPSATVVPAEVAPDDIATLLYTSGSTGMPKGIAQTHAGLHDGARLVGGSGFLGLSADDHILAVLPSSFDYGMNQVLSAAYAGCRVTPHAFFTASQLVKTIETVGATGLAGVPELLVGFVDAVAARLPEAARQLRSLRYVTNSGGRLPLRVIEFFRQELPWVQVFSMYGLTEAFRSSFVPPDELPERASTVGRAMPGVELLVVDPDQGTLLGPDEVGELVHCGACVAAGYWRDEAATEQRFRPHPVRGLEAGGTCVFTGDLASMDADGYVTVVGRADEQLKIQGYRIAPDEVAFHVLGVDGVQTAAVTSVRRGDDGLPVLVAAIVPDSAADPDDLPGAVVARCRQRLPAYMVPGEVHVLGSLPLNPNHKLSYGALRALLEERTPESDS